MSEPSPQTDKPARGLLNEASSLRHFKLDMYQPAEELSGVVDHVWHVHWNLREGESYQQSNLPHPVQHIVFDPLRGSGLFGCSTKRFDYEVSGTGQVLGFKLFPGMGRAFHQAAMSEIVDQRVPFDQLAGIQAAELEAGFTQNSDLAKALQVCGQVLADIVGPVDQAMLEARQAVEFIERSADFFRVADVARYLGVRERQLQRLFATNVGVSPKWVIDRYRMLEAVDILNGGERVDLAQLALELGYTDQPHFANQFKAITGTSPSAYMRQ